MFHLTVLSVEFLSTIQIYNFSDTTKVSQCKWKSSDVMLKVQCRNNFVNNKKRKWNVKTTKYLNGMYKTKETQ